MKKNPPVRSAWIALLAILWALLAQPLLGAAQPGSVRFAGEICSADGGIRLAASHPDAPAPADSLHAAQHCAWCTASGHLPFIPANSRSDAQSDLAYRHELAQSSSAASRPATR